jgi:uncharacterized RmlC-like cupin family protein
MTMRDPLRVNQQLGLGCKRLIRGCLAVLALALPSDAFAHPLDSGLRPAPSTQTIVVPGSGGVAVARPHGPTITKQQVEIYRGISLATAGSKQLSMNRIILRPGTQGLRHQHHNAETVIYVLEGQARTLIGLNGELVVDTQAGEFLFIPAGVWHQPVNVSDRPAIAIEARADADDQSNVILAPNQP